MKRLVTIMFLAMATNVQSQSTDQQLIQELYATLTGRSRVTAAVFGGGRHTWPLQLRFQLVKRDGQWLFTEARASTY